MNYEHDLFKEDLHGIHISQICSTNEANSCSDVIEDPSASEWIASMNDEPNTLKSKETFESVDEIPANCSIIKSKWVFETNFYRTALSEVSLSGMWLFLSERSETFSPILKLKLFKLILALANDLDYEIDYIDITCAFLKANLQEEIYIRLPDVMN